MGSASASTTLKKKKSEKELTNFYRFQLKEARKERSYCRPLLATVLSLRTLSPALVTRHHQCTQSVYTNMACSLACCVAFLHTHCLVSFFTVCCLHFITNFHSRPHLLPCVQKSPSCDASLTSTSRRYSRCERHESSSHANQRFLFCIVLSEYNPACSSFVLGKFEIHHHVQRKRHSFVATTITHEHVDSVKRDIQ